ncbi:MAG: iron dependent repressor, metal binding and dimerization domain protein [Tissierellia bacterium]|nr:iron dependent repressor, metal binding and dimerization domain protein [Tissierellia bacterium]MDD4779458.1 iron dependent repressor, metal binding and dimerization domain protein [Tissierellia bacterium]
MKNSDFYTFRGYRIKDEKLLSPSMEDYIEMIYRLSIEKDIVRVNNLSEALNVQPPSITKMIKRLSNDGFVNYEKYGSIKLTEKGIEKGKFFLFRHETIYEFLELIGVKENLLEQTEKMEHAIYEETLEKISNLIIFLKNNIDFNS